MAGVPISVNTQPALLARNGIGIVSRANQENHLRSGMRPRRVSHSATTANNTGMAKRPIMSESPVRHEQVGTIVAGTETLFLLLLKVIDALERDAAELPFGEEWQDVRALR